MSESVALKAKRNSRGYEDAVWTAPGESPDTFNGEKLQYIVSPKNSPVEYKFYTDGEPNTEYILTRAGESRRIKGDQGWGDHGLHAWSDIMLFAANQQDARDFADAVCDRNERIPGWKPGMKQAKSLFRLGGGRYTLAYTVDGKRWFTYDGLPSSRETQEKSSFVKRFETKPALGYTTLDMKFKRLPAGGFQISSVHYGHKVCWIEK